MNMFCYLRQYWSGAQPLWRAFFLNLIILGALILWLLDSGLPWLHINRVLPVHLLASAALGLLLPVLIWQIVGLWRTLRLRLSAFGGVNDSWVIYAGMLGYLWLLLLAVLDLSRFVTLSPPPAAERPRTELTLVQTRSAPLSSAVGLYGAIEFGLTRDLEMLLRADPTINTLWLDSTGGYIGEARGVMRLVREYKLATHVERECFSACTLIFVSSLERTIGPAAQLGFHQYTLLPGYNTPWVDPVEQQKMDRELMLTQGISQWFVDRAYAEPHTSLWRPTVEELVDSAMVMEVTQGHSSSRRDPAQSLTPAAQ